MNKYHSIYFYDLYNQAQTESIDAILEKCFSHEAEIYPFYIGKKKYAFDILEADNEHYFGRLSRFDDYKESLTTIKTKKDEQPLNPDDYIFEKFTFFYIQLAKDAQKPSRLSTITNNSINIEKCFQKYFLKFYPMLPILIFPTLSKDLNGRLANLKEVTRVECTFSDNSVANNQTSFNNLFDCGCYLRNVSMKTSFKEKKPPKLDSLLENANARFQKLKIHGITDTGVDTIDVLTQIFIKKSKIEMSTISINNFEPIKRALSNFSAP